MALEAATVDLEVDTAPVAPTVVATAPHSPTLWRPPAGYPSTYGSTPPPPQSAYDAPPVTVYGAPPVTVTTGYGTGAVGADGKKNKMGMGLAVGAAAGVLGWLALSGGSSYLEDKFEERLSKRVEENLEREYSYGGSGGYRESL